MARDLCGGAAAAPKRTTAVVDDSFIVAGAAWAGLTAALTRNIVLVANHLLVGVGVGYLRSENSNGFTRLKPTVTLRLYHFFYKYTRNRQSADVARKRT